MLFLLSLWLILTSTQQKRHDVKSNAFAPEATLLFTELLFLLCRYKTGKYYWNVVDVGKAFVNPFGNLLTLTNYSRKVNVSFPLSTVRRWERLWSTLISQGNWDFLANYAKFAWQIHISWQPYLSVFIFPFLSVFVHITR